MTKQKTRIEEDALGTQLIPADSYGGIFWYRAMQNFSNSSRIFPFVFYQNLARIKKCIIEEHVHTKRIDARIGKPIIRAANEIIRGKAYPEFSLDVFQAGAGTPINMTMNEVLANRALELLKQRKGKYSLISPHTHLNMMQSTNDVIPTAIRLTLIEKNHLLEKELIQTIHVAEELSKKYARVLKVGRTHLQTAVPVTFGQELDTYTQSLRQSLLFIRRANHGLLELPLGGTAVGTGITTVPGFDVKIVKRLQKETGEKLTPSHRKMFHTSHETMVLHYAHALSLLSSELLVWANDWILLSSDPHAGIGEIILPPVEPGSSIMAGKINPSILEAMRMICLQVRGNTETVQLASESTQFELNVMTPVMASNLFESQELLTNGLHMFREKCLRKTKPSPKMKQLLDESVALATALNPYLGYDVVAHLVKKTIAQHGKLSTLLLSEGWLLPPELNEILSPEKMTRSTSINSSLQKKIRTRPIYQKTLAHLERFAR